jgi:hypothetical protein
MKLALITTALVLCGPLAYGQTVLPEPGGIKWEPMPKILTQADGAQCALISGDMKAGPWVIRFKFPTGYAIQPHTHDEIENVTVLSGTANMGMGEKFDKATTTPISAGGFFSMPGGHAHYVYFTEPTIVQVHSGGPSTFHYINPADDPSKSRKGQ